MNKVSMKTICEWWVMMGLWDGDPKELYNTVPFWHLIEVYAAFHPITEKPENPVVGDLYLDKIYNGKEWV